MTVREKVKTIDNKLEQNKAQFNLDRETTKISLLTSGSVAKYELLSVKYVLAEKCLLEKAALTNRSEYSPLGIELKKQTQCTKKVSFKN